MKPRIRWMEMRQVWVCTAANWMRTGIIGHGYTPARAYAEWEALGGLGGRFT